MRPGITSGLAPLIAIMSLTAILAAGCTPSSSPVPEPAAPAPSPAEAKKPNGLTPVPDAGKKESADAVMGGGSGGWLTFRGSPQRTGRADVAGPRTAKLAWVFRTKGRIYADAAISADGQTIYVASHDHNLYAIGVDGRKRWTYDAKDKIWTSPSIGRDGTIYFGSDADRLVALEPSGKERWVFDASQPPARGDKPEAGRYDVDTSPAVTADGSIIFGSHTNLFALRPASGELRWLFEAGTGRAKVFASPALGHDGSIYFGTQGSYFFGLNGSAKVLWNIKTGGDNDSTPAVGADGTVYFASDDKKLRAVAPGGALRWEIDLGAPVRAPISLGLNGAVIASTFGKEPFIAAHDKDTGKELWRFSIAPGDGAFYGIQSGALIDSEGYVYFGGRDHFVYCLSPKGELVWKYETGDQVDSGPVMGADGTVYVGSDDKRLYAFAR